ncbi:MAG: cytochrome C oxidase subunit IV family protein [Planctomycetota bacterium]|jgi:cytochrome c oxidase subunit 4
MRLNYQDEHQVVPYGLYLKIWVSLVILTVITVSVSYLDMKHVAILTALLIAMVKSTLVLLYFMHIRFEKPLYAVLLVAVIATYAVFIGLTFVDYWYR